MKQENKLSQIRERIDILSKAVGFTIVLFIIGLVTFPLGIIAWILAIFTLLGGIATAIVGDSDD